MAHIIKLTEKQINQIMESTWDGGLESPSEIPEYTKSMTTSDGKKDEENFAKPVTTDNFAAKMAKSFPWGVGAYYKGYVSPMVQEDTTPSTTTDVYNDSDKTGDGVKDKFNHADANVLTNGNEEDDQQIIPYSVERYLDKLIDVANQANLTPKKKINIVNKLVDKLDLKDLPPSYKKETSMKIFAK